MALQFVRKLVPPSGIARSLAAQTVIFSIGQGLFVTGSVVFFTKMIGLSAVQIGVGLSVAAFISLVGSVPFGVLADRVGAKRLWVIAAFAQAALFAAYPLVGNWVAFLVVVSTLAVASGANDAGRGNYVLDAVPADDRVTVLAYQRSAMNVGYSVGAGLAAITLSIQSEAAYLAMPLGYAAVLVVSTLYVLRLPAAPLNEHPKKSLRSFVGVFADLPFLSLSVVNAIIGVHGLILLTLVPLWLLSDTDAPKRLIAVIAIANTIVVTLLQVHFSKGGESAIGAAQALRRAGVALAAGCAVIGISALSHGWATITVLVIGAMLITAAEMWQATGMWAIGAYVPSPQHRGQYRGALRMARQLHDVVAPTALVALIVVRGGPSGWLLLAVLVGITALVAVPVMRWVERTDRLDAAPVVAAAPPPGSAQLATTNGETTA